MSKNSFKKTIQERYKGRGNSWVKVMKDQEGASQIKNALNTIKNNEADVYKEHTTREGFYWIRFSKVEGTSEQPKTRFEIRYKGCKEDHPDFTVVFDDTIAKEFILLGNTPFKLQLESSPKDRKPTKIDIIRKLRPKNNSKDIVDDIEIDLEEEVKIIKEAVLTKPSDKELEKWYEFLKINNLYEENV
tara:strand:- start:3930 stop:4493 length:564 start_codon:yes stop_codon:yes gene_type:complete